MQGLSSCVAYVGRANQIEFEPTKESVHVMARTGGTDGFFPMLGAKFDSQLLMRDTLQDMATGASWRLRNLLKSRRFFTTPELVFHYKAQVVSYLESITSTVYHCCDTSLREVEGVQGRFLRDVNLEPIQVLQPH